MYVFGTGNLFGTATQDAAGNTIANPSPLKFGELQDISLDIARDLKPLHGQNMLPVAVGGGKMKFDFKAKFARLNGQIFNDLFFGTTMTAGTLTGVVNDTVGTAIPASPYQITVVPPGSGTFVRDLGVVDANGNGMKRVASAPATGQYSVSAGVYTFAAADTGKVAFISYTYTATSANARTISIGNLPMGYTPIFGVDLAGSYAGKQCNYRFPQCVAGKLSIAPKQDDFTVADLDISAFTDATGNIGYISFAE